MKTSEAQKKASKKYRLAHKEYYKQKAIENSKKVRQERKEYKARIEKAVEYIEKHTEKIYKRFTIPKIDFNYNELLNILQGDNNE